MLVSEIATRVKREFGDETGAQINDTDIMRWCNDGQIELVLSNDLLQIQSNQNATPGVAAYAQPSTPVMMTLHSILYKSFKLKGISIQQADETWNRLSPPSGDPTEFYLFANTINMYPVPADAGQITIRYTQQPTLITATTDTPQIPIQYHNRLVDYCLAKAYALDGRPDLEQEKLSQFISGAASAKDNESWEQRDFYPSISASPADYGYPDLGQGGWY